MVRPSYVYRYKNRNFVLLRNTRGSKYTLSFANGFLIFLDRSSLLFSSPLLSSHLSSTKFRELRVENGNSTRTMISPPFTFRRKFTNAIAALPRVRHSSCSWPVWEEEEKKKKKGKGRRGTLQVTHTITHTGVARRARRFVSSCRPSAFPFVKDDARRGAPRCFEADSTTIIATDQTIAKYSRAHDSRLAFTLDGDERFSSGKPCVTRARLLSIGKKAKVCTGCVSLSACI